MRERNNNERKGCAGEFMGLVTVLDLGRRLMDPTDHRAKIAAEAFLHGANMDAVAGMLYAKQKNDNSGNDSERS